MHLDPLRPPHPELRGDLMVTLHRPRPAGAAGAAGAILVRGDSAYGSAAVIGVALREGAQFSVVLAKTPAVLRAIASIDEQAWTPVRYPGAVCDPDTGALISDAEVAEVSYTAFAGSKHP